jgi:uncharacterized protein
MMARAWSHGTFYWNELMTRDAERDKKFYSEAIGWHCPRFEGVPEVWIAYLAVDEVDASVNKAQALALN